jgi:hypothetical protein
MTKLDLPLLLGRKAKDARELMAGVREVPLMSIYFDTHRFMHQHNYLSPEPPNDVAYWTANVLNDAVLGEQLASLDIVQCGSIQEIREKFLAILEEYVTAAERTIECPRGEEFHFMSCQTFVFPTSYSAASLGEFCDGLGKVSVNALYYHMFDARMRPELGVNDFSVWMRDNGYEELAEKIQALDPYTHTLEGQRKTIMQLVSDYGSHP